MKGIKIDNILENLEYIENYVEAKPEQIDKSKELGELMNVSEHNKYFDSLKSKNEIMKLIDSEKRLRMILGARNLDIVGKIKTVFNYYASGDKNYYPKMRDIIDSELKIMDQRKDELTLIIGEIKINQNKLDKYYNHVIDRWAEAQTEMHKASAKRDKLKENLNQIKKLYDINKVHVEPDDVLNFARILKVNYSAQAHYNNETRSYVSNKLESELRIKQSNDLKSISNFTNAVNLSSSLVLKYAEVLSEHIQHTKFIYDLIPETLQKELAIEKNQKNLNSMVLEYKRILGDLFQYKYNKLGKILNNYDKKDLFIEEFKEDIKKMQGDNDKPY